MKMLPGLLVLSLLAFSSVHAPAAPHVALYGIGLLAEGSPLGGMRTVDGRNFATKGCTGIYAARVTFTSPVYAGDINAFDAATPMLLLGGAAGNTWINGGDLLQTNGVTAKSNRAVLKQNGVDVTTQIVVNPGP
jgi:hypothetical protein